MAKVSIIMFRNALTVPIMDNSTILLFIMIEAGLVVKDTEKTHAMDPYVKDHIIQSNTCLKFFRE